MKMGINVVSRDKNQSSQVVLGSRFRIPSIEVQTHIKGWVNGLLLDFD